ncbi:MAG TPA: SDR family oxidoreductase [Chlamydiales bacterium]|jgi:NADP-dependent 3-hydroxy acid dehydrogenase YdfG|nr:SDR family oxidoreductase [Chlamydiales bacterium]
MNKKLVVITGASAGIGKAIAVHFSRAGYPLLLIARRLAKLKELRLPNTYCAEVDVTDLSKFSAAIKKGEEKFGEVECLINNAGVFFAEPFETQDPQDWKKMVDVNILGILNGMHLILNKMKERQTGTIFNISSLAGRKTFPSGAVYCATKYAVHGLTESIREEMADHNVRVITIAPGNVKTEIWDQAVAEEKKHHYSAYQRKPYENLDPEDIAKAILFAYEQPQNVCIREMVICPTRQIV